MEASFKEPGQAETWAVVLDLGFYQSFVTPEMKRDIAFVIKTRLTYDAWPLWPHFRDQLIGCVLKSLTAAVRFPMYSTRVAVLLVCSNLRCYEETFLFLRTPSFIITFWKVTLNFDMTKFLV